MPLRRDARRKTIVAATFFFAVFANSIVDADIVSFSFSGHVANVTRDGLDQPIVVDGSTVSRGDTVLGSFEFDTMTSPDRLFTPAWAFYPIEQPRYFHVDIAGVRFSNFGTFAIVVANGFDVSIFDSGVPSQSRFWDYFEVYDGTDPLNPLGNVAGSTILANDSEIQGQSGINLTDFTATAFNNVGLPNDLDLTRLNGGERGAINGRNIDDSLFSISYEITSLRAISIPEPNSDLAAFVATVLYAIAWRRRK